MDIVFVAGPPRSGTTLISGLLQGEETYPMLPECTYLTRIISLCHEIKTYPDKTRFTSFIKSNESLYRIFQPSVKAMIENTVSDYESKNILVLKDPELSKVLDILPDLIPYSFKVVACIRDPRDVVFSWQNVLKKQGKTYDFIEEISIIFSYYHGIMQAETTLPNGMLKIVRYEDVLKQEGAYELEQFTGCRVNSDSPYTNRSFEFDTADPFASVNYGRHITLGSLRRFEKDLSKSEVSQVEEMFAGVMVWGSYE